MSGTAAGACAFTSDFNMFSTAIHSFICNTINIYGVSYSCSVLKDMIEMKANGNLDGALSFGILFFYSLLSMLTPLGSTGLHK